MAKKQKPQMTIYYCKERDEYQLLTRQSENDDFQFNIACKCYRCEHDKPDAEPMFISVAMINEIKKLLKWGYELV